mgnify:CR=1 FL=1
MNLCSHEIVFGYSDNHPRKMMIDGSYYCPACGKLIRCYDHDDLLQGSFKYSKVIPLDYLFLYGTNEMLQTLRDEVFSNMDFYYSPDSSVDLLSHKMEDVLKEFSYDYCKDKQFLKNKKILLIRLNKL